MPAASVSPIHGAIAKVATGPEYSKDLSYDEAYAAMKYILSDDADPVQSAVFFIALRMKRETDDENRGILQALLDTKSTPQVAVDHLIDLSDPYDGYIRGMPVTPFLPAVFAACGYPTVAHGLNEVGPKFGATHYKILKAAGRAIDVSLEQGKANLENPELGWTYIDQSVFCPKLHDMVTLRQRMIKRQVMTTVEVLTKPYEAQGQTHILTGYVHKAYPPIYSSLARHAGFNSMVLVRGVEGGVTPSLKQPGRYFRYLDGGAEEQIDTNPADLNIIQDSRNVPLPEDLADIEENRSPERIEELAARSAEAGLDALKGAKGAARDSLIYTGAMMLQHLEKIDLQNAGAKIAQVLDSGAALNRFEQHQ